MVDYAKMVLPLDAEVTTILTAVAQGPRTAQELVLSFAPERQAFLFRSLVFLVKLNVLRTCH